VLVVAEHDGTDRILLEVERKTEGVLRKLEHFAITRIGEPVDAYDAVRDADDGADIASFGCRLEIFDSLFNQLADFRSLECHVAFLC
jgi:hypothetical protein